MLLLLLLLWEMGTTSKIEIDRQTTINNNKIYLLVSIDRSTDQTFFRNADGWMDGLPLVDACMRGEKELFFLLTVMMIENDEEAILARVYIYRYIYIYIYMYTPLG